MKIVSTMVSAAVKVTVLVKESLWIVRAHVVVLLRLILMIMGLMVYLLLKSWMKRATVPPIFVLMRVKGMV